MTSLFLENMAFATAALLFVLVLRQPVARLFGASWAYALWALPALRLLLPPLPDFGAEILPPLTSVVSLAGDSAASVPSQDGSGQWMPILLAVWAAGAAVFILWQWLAYRSFLARLTVSSRSAGEHEGLPLVESAAVEGPLAVGLLDRRIVVPADFSSRYSAAEQRLALDHEAIHHRRGDIWWNLGALLFLALNWFNPVAWFAFRAYRADQELACDAAVAAAAGPEERHDYARALVKSASRPGLIAACPLNSADQLKRRLKMMNMHRRSRLRSAGGTAALLAAIVATAGLGTASAQDRREADRDERERIIILETRDGERARSERRARRGHRPPHVIMMRRGDNGEIIAPEGCSGGDVRQGRAERGGGRPPRIIMCGPRGEASAEQRLRALEAARGRIAEALDERGADHRSRVLELIDREIERLRAR